MSPATRRAARILPLAVIWTVAAWPFALWLVQLDDPELAVRIGRAATTAVTKTGLVLAGIALVLCVGYPPALAGVRLGFDRTLQSLTNDRRPLLRALGELRHFESSARHFEVGRLALHRGEVDLARKHLQAAIALDGSVAGAHHQLGMLLFRQRQWQQAAAEFDLAQQLDPGHAFGDALLHAGRCAHLLGRHQDAAALLREHERVHGGNRKSHFWLAETLTAIADREGVIAAYVFAASPPKQRLSAEENWFRAKARARLWGRGGVR